MKVAAFLPAKGTSERIPSKNQKLLDGKPLFLHTLEKLVEMDCIDQVYLDSESDEILNYADYLPYQKLKRDPALANNKTDGHQMFYNEVKQVDADIYLQILGTSPFIQPSTIQKGIQVLKECPEYDSVVLVKREKQYCWEAGQPAYDKNHIPNSVDLPDTVIETMGLYMVRKQTALAQHKRIGEHPYLLEAEPIEAIDVNFPADFALAELIAKGLRAKRMQYLRTLKGSFNSSIFSDILDEYGLRTVIQGLSCPIPGTKIFGYANTLKIRKLQEGEDYRGIYRALESYGKMRMGDIILVENEVPDRAYFGELNANLAVRAGAEGTIVGGVTRDMQEVKKLGYPVFSAGYCCGDVKRVATVEQMGCPIQIRGITICPGDLIFGDENGIVVIPHRLEKEVLDKAVQTVAKEKDILGKIIQQEDAQSIYQTAGEF